MMNLELCLMKGFVLSKTKELQKRMKEMQDNQLQLQCNLIAVQTCLGTTLRKMGEIHRFYESKLGLFEGTLTHNLTTGNKTFNDTKKSTELLSHEIAVVNEIAMMNKNQLELLATDFNTHLCYH